jgi:hypothetical protein
MLTPNQFALFMFVTLSQQAEAWAYMLKGNMKMEAKMILNRYLAGAKSLGDFIKEHYNIDDLNEQGAVWGELMQRLVEMPTEKRELLYIAMMEFVNGNFILDKDESPKEVTHIP